MQRITPFLWFDNNAEEAAKFYTSIFKNSSINHIARRPASVPGEEGAAMVVSFTLDGQVFTALNGGPMYQFTEAVSMVIHCKNQEEVDYYWQHLTADGGEPGRCGWLKDKFGFSWQVVPDQMASLMASPNPGKSAKAMEAMMGMNKLDIAALEQAYAEG
jgi:predicted 3-demethylubiquinone-9 3-methyltransferase (glyoxalase superfamily)